jgi:glycosyltransferase involved in cell wall biosynthesis
MNNNAVRDLTSIIIACWNQVEFTQQCIAALKRHTLPQWELIVVDNGSTDETAAYLAGVRDMSAVPVTVVTNATNLGFPAAVNQGLRLARGEYLVLLNNDVVVTDGWLDQLIALVNANRGPSAGGSAGTCAGDVNGSAGTSLPSPVGIVPGSAESTPPPSGVVPGFAGSTPPPCSGIVRDSAGTTPPGPPFARGGKVLVPPSVDPERDGVEAGEPSAATSSLPNADGVPPTVRGIGLVGPMSNYAAPPQLVDGVPYHDMEGMRGFARRWRDEHLGKWFNAPKLSGFCLLMKRDVYDTIGGLDERFGIGFFDDDDLAERARRAGFELAVAHDLFVHHFGSRTFAGNGIDAERLLDKNAGRFAEKWGLAAINGRKVSMRPYADRPRRIPDFKSPSPDPRFRIRGSSSRNEGENHLDCQSRVPDSRRTEAGESHFSTAISGSSAREVKVSLTMIVRDEENNLPHCLESVRGLFDEMIIVDTGSIDRTKEIAREFGAKVFDFVWIDDFAAARNEALSHATGDYAFWLDADDVVEPIEIEKLRALLQQLRAGDRAAYVVRCACDPSPDGTGGDTVVDHIRLFPVHEDVRWTYRVHEQILPSLRRAKISVRWTDLTVRHTGYVDKALRARKLERDIAILKRELEDRPSDPFVLFNLGAIAVERSAWDEALDFLKRSLAGSAPSDSIVRKLFALIARTHQMMGDSQGALRACAQGLELDPEDAELWFRKAVVHRHRGESSEAERCWRLILKLRRPDQFCSVDQGIYGHLTRRNLAALAAERGDHAEARRLWEAVLAECRGDGEALAKLGRFREKTLTPSPS